MSKRKGLTYGICIPAYAVGLTSIFQPSRKRATISYTKLSFVNIQSNCEQLEEDLWLTRGMITLHTYMMLRSVGSIIRKGVTNTTDKYHQASPMRGLFVSSVCSLMPTNPHLPRCVLELIVATFPHISH